MDILLNGFGTAGKGTRSGEPNARLFFCWNQVKNV